MSAIEGRKGCRCQGDAFLAKPYLQFSIDDAIEGVFVKGPNLDGESALPTPFA